MRRTLIVLLIILLVVGGAGGVWLKRALEDRPDVARYASLAVDDGAAPAGGLSVTFLGVSTLLLRDAKSAVLIDGFFTRPDLWSTAVGKVSPDTEAIANALARAGVDRLDAVVAVHSHYDHAMDSPDVAKLTGAVVVGSASTANIARGRGLTEDRIRIVKDGETLRFGDLAVTLVAGAHFPHGQAMGEITAPLVPPVRALDYLEGGSYSVLVERAGRSVLVQGSAGYVEGALAGRKADVVFLGIGLLGSRDEEYREAYWRETVTAVGAKRVVPIHWDDFTRPLEEPLVALPFLLDDLDASMEFVLARAGRDEVQVRWPILWRGVDPFAGL
jgi:L-ascorbate metabolism protein UlaG (beta-lactamase superfamily)